MERRPDNAKEDSPRPAARVAIIHVAIACCAVTMAVAIAVAIAAG